MKIARKIKRKETVSDKAWRVVKVLFISAGIFTALRIAAFYLLRH